MVLVSGNLGSADSGRFRQQRKGSIVGKLRAVKVLLGRLLCARNQQYGETNRWLARRLLGGLLAGEDV